MWASITANRIEMRHRRLDSIGERTKRYAEDIAYHCCYVVFLLFETMMIIIIVVVAVVVVSIGDV